MMRQVLRCTGWCLQNLDPDFSPDGDSIAFNRLVGPSILKGKTRPYKISYPHWKNYGAIFISGLDGSDPHQVTETPKLRPPDEPPGNGEPAFSPDGKMLAFVRTHFPEESHTVFVQPIDSPGDAHQATPWNLHCQERPEFSPDGKLMLFRCLPKGEEGPANLYWAHPDGTGLHKLTHAPAAKQYLGSSFSPSFNKGEGWITVGRTAGYGKEGNADVFRVRVENGGVVRKVNLTKSAIWDSGPNWGTHPPVD